MKFLVSVRSDGSKRVQTVFEGPSKTRQEFKKDCDLALIIKRFSKTPEGLKALQDSQNLFGGSFQDVSCVPDYRTARDQINRADEVFGALPSVLRARFANDPARFLDFALDPRNLDEMRALGLAKSKSVADVSTQPAPAPVKG